MIYFFIIFIYRYVKPVENIKKKKKNLINLTKEMHIKHFSFLFYY